jgi:hypothetical protein
MTSFPFCFPRVERVLWRVGYRPRLPIGFTNKGLTGAQTDVLCPFKQLEGCCVDARETYPQPVVCATSYRF